ncbi:hypothetical protein H6796_02270 [Candidatus Nomurabacteria bacterium]|nr:hypothetical protein [Candidatus Nomurabacteria bacterium]
MKEFDFDELDRAMSSLLGQANKNEEASSPAPASGTTSDSAPSESGGQPSSTDNDAATTDSRPNVDTDISADANINDSPEVKREEEIVSQEAAEPPVAAAPILPHRRGTVVDGFHRKPRQAATVTQSSPSRVGKTLEPSSQIKASLSIDGLSASRNLDADASNGGKSESLSDSQEAAQDNNPESNLLTKSDDSAPISLDSTEKSTDTDTENDAPASNSSVDVTQPVAPADETSPKADPTESTNITVPGQEPSRAQDPIAKGLPKTLQSNSSPFIPNAKVEKRPLDANMSSSSSTSGPDSKSAVMPVELQNELVSIESKDVDATDGSAANNIGGGAVSDQFKTPKEDNAQQPQADIYATAAGTQPLQHPAKQKSGITRVIWIVLLLVVGAGGAAALYFSGIL